MLILTAGKLLLASLSISLAPAQLLQLPVICASASLWPWVKKLLFSLGAAPKLSLGGLSYPKFVTIAGVFLTLCSSQQAKPPGSAGLPEVPHSPAPGGPGSAV